MRRAGSAGFIILLVVLGAVTLGYLMERDMISLDGDTVSDSDGDGVPDDEDYCPGTDEDRPIIKKQSDLNTENGIGCYDTDGDGYPDAQDACRTDPERYYIGCDEPLSGR